MVLRAQKVCAEFLEKKKKKCISQKPSTPRGGKSGNENFGTLGPHLPLHFREMSYIMHPEHRRLHDTAIIFA